MNVRSFVLVVVTMVCAVAPVHGDTPTATLKWDTSLEAGVAGYIVYVGQASGSYDETFDVKQQTSFVYTDALPGRPYFFSVAAYTSSREVGPRSEEILFLAGTSTMLPVRVESTLGASPPRSASARSIPSVELNAACFASTCYGIETIASLDDPSGLTRTTDGRVLFIENGRHVRVIEGGRLVAGPALTAEPGSTLAVLALDPSFGETGFVFVGVVRGTGDRQMDVVRYREVANTLGEGAVIVAGLPLSAAGDAALAVDAARRLYVAMPAASHPAKPQRYSGAVLRFESDGTAVHGDGANAPVFSTGYAQPASLAWTGDGNALWLAGTDESDAAGLTRIPLSNGPGSTPVPESVVRPEGIRVRSLAGRTPLILVDEAGGVFRVVVAADEISTVPWIAPAAVGGTVVSAVSDPSESDIYLAVGDHHQPAGTASRILRLRLQ